MSQIITYPQPAVAAGILTETGNSGGAISPSGTGNLTLLANAPFSFVGTPLTNTLTLTQFKSAFSAGLNTTVSSVTGDGTTYTVVWDTVFYDLNSDFGALGNTAFTAPVAGIYTFNYVLQLGNVVSAATYAGKIEVDTTSQNYVVQFFNPAACAFSAIGNGTIDLAGSLTIKLAALDTVSLAVTLYGGSLSVDVPGNSGSGGPLQTFWSGCLLYQL